LASKGLTKQGALWLLPGDLQLREGLRTTRQAKVKLENVQKRRLEIQDQMRGADDALGQIMARFENVNDQMEVVFKSNAGTGWPRSWTLATTIWRRFSIYRTRWRRPRGNMRVWPPTRG
jgi:hypothetical protein